MVGCAEFLSQCRSHFGHLVWGNLLIPFELGNVYLPLRKSSRSHLTDKYFVIVVIVVTVEFHNLLTVSVIVVVLD